jgi:hypothetical protein
MSNYRDSSEKYQRKSVKTRLLDTVYHSGPRTTYWNPPDMSVLAILEKRREKERVRDEHTTYV